MLREKLRTVYHHDEFLVGRTYHLIFDDCVNHDHFLMTTFDFALGQYKLVDNRWEFDKETSLVLPDLPRANGEEDDRSLSVGDLDEDGEMQGLLSGSKLGEGLHMFCKLAWPS
jgi:hypothetical protein